jgi:hypothetical protein
MSDVTVKIQAKIEVELNGDSMSHNQQNLER